MCVLFFIPLNAQFGEKHIIDFVPGSPSVNGPVTIVPADFDLDGDLDIASSTFFDNKVSWY